MGILFKTIFYTLFLVNISSVNALSNPVIEQSLIDQCAKQLIVDIRPICDDSYQIMISKIKDFLKDRISSNFMEEEQRILNTYLIFLFVGRHLSHEHPWAVFVSSYALEVKRLLMEDCKKRYELCIKSKATSCEEYLQNINKVRNDLTTPREVLSIKIDISKKLAQSLTYQLDIEGTKEDL